MSELLTRYRRLHASSAEEVRDGLANALQPLHKWYTPLRHREPTRATIMNATSIGPLRLGYFLYSSPATVQSTGPSGLVKIILPLTGRVDCRSGRHELAGHRQAAAVLSADDFDLSIEPNTSLISMSLARDDLEGQLRKMLGRPCTSRLLPNTTIDMRTPVAQSWLSTLQMLYRDLDGSRGLTHTKLLPPTVQLVLSQFLIAVPASDNHDLSALHEATSPRTTPRAILRADQLITDHAHEDLTVADIAEAVGISLRSLQEGFRRHLDTTPTLRLLQARLAGARASLSATDPQHDTVTRIAHHWGFTHLGRFASSYRTAFGESPSTTLQR